MEQIRALDSIKDMARRAFVRNAPVNPFPAGTVLAEVWQQAYDECDAAHAHLRVLLPQRMEA